MSSYCVRHLENCTEKINQLVLCHSLADAAMAMANKRYANIHR